MHLQRTNDSNSTREHLLSQVDEISDVLLAEIPTDEANRRLSDKSYAALYDAGLFNMKLPKVLGGFEADLVTQLDVLEALATVSSSAAWCTMVGATSLGMPGAFLPEAGVGKMFANNAMPKGAIVIMPTGKATPVSGGYSLSGRWAFASGVYHAEWVSAHVMVQAEPNAEPALYMFSFPASEVTLHDTWQVLGLRGTGSCDISVDQLFVPEEMTWQVGVQTPQRGGALFELGIPAFVAYEHAAFALGVARSALNEITENAATKKRGYGPDAALLRNRQTVQRFIGHSNLKLDAARALAVTLNQQAMDDIEQGRTIDNKLAIELRAVATYCTEVSVEITTEALRHSGASAIYEKSNMQRLLRDINVAAQHLMVSDISYELLGQSHFGFPEVPPMA